jgi:hypothetical protein
MWPRNLPQLLLVSKNQHLTAMRILPFAKKGQDVLIKVKFCVISMWNIAVSCSQKDLYHSIPFYFEVFAVSEISQ